MAALRKLSIDFHDFFRLSIAVKIVKSFFNAERGRKIKRTVAEQVSLESARVVHSYYKEFRYKIIKRYMLKS